MLSIKRGVAPGPADVIHKNVKAVAGPVANRENVNSKAEKINDTT